MIDTRGDRDFLSLSAEREHRDEVKMGRDFCVERGMRACSGRGSIMMMVMMIELIR